MAVNPFGFKAGPVTFWLIVVYAAFLIPLVWIHEDVPSFKEHATPRGVSLNDAWTDLTTITREYHPYNSRANEEVGDYLLQRIEQILKSNGIEWTKEKEAGGIVRPQLDGDVVSAPPRHDAVNRASSGPLVTIFDDTISNVTYSDSRGDTTVYFEGTNKLVYIRGTEDEDGEWWKNTKGGRRIGKGGVLVNAHYDSVASGYGATDDGMGCVSILQMLSYFTSEGQQPKRGIVLLLNNGEEDGLYGANAYVYSPLYYFTTTFVNLEGAGAGGRAMMFRGTDLETVKAYTHAPHPFGSVVAADAFNRGFIKSATDWSVWTEKFGQRGLDIAFYRPRARYHTNQDDARHASRASLWHMLSSSLAAVDALQKDTSSFLSSRNDGNKGKVSSGSGTRGVWFDMFGLGFAVLELRGLFAWTLTLLVVTPLVLILVTYLLARQDKYYYFSRNVRLDQEDETVRLGGWRGFFRFPLALTFSVALTMVSAYLVHRINPYVVYNNTYSLWLMSLSLFFFSFWVISKGAATIRPSALQRGYAYFWLFTISWAILVVVTVFADRMQIASGYPFAFFHSGIFVAALISLLELSALPAKQDYAQATFDDQQAMDHISEVPNADALITPGPNEGGNGTGNHADEAEEEPSETTPLRNGENGNHGTIRPTFATGYRRSISAIMGDTEETKDTPKPAEKEQSWSAKLPSWTWFLQLLVLAPITIVIFSQVGLFVTAAAQHTSADGGDPLLSYLVIAIFSIIILLPITPFIHRTFYLHRLLLLVFIISLIYNLIASPFSPDNRCKVRFQQDLDLVNGSSTVTISGIKECVRGTVAELPSAAGQNACDKARIEFNLFKCEFDASAVLPKLTSSISTDFSKDKYAGLVRVNVSRSKSDKGKFTLDIEATESKMCTLAFDQPVLGFSVRGSPGVNPILSPGSKISEKSFVLWRRDWSKPWTVDIESDNEAKPTGTIKCAWSDANVRGTIPAFDEVLQFAPNWIGVTKAGVGLVWGAKGF